MYCKREIPFFGDNQICDKDKNNYFENHFFTIVRSLLIIISIFT